MNKEERERIHKLSDSLRAQVIPLTEARKIRGLEKLSGPYGLVRKDQIDMICDAIEHLQRAGSIFRIVEEHVRGTKVSIWRTDMVAPDATIHWRKMEQKRGKK